MVPEMLMLARLMFSSASGSSEDCDSLSEGSFWLQQAVLRQEIYSYMCKVPTRVVAIMWGPIMPLNRLNGEWMNKTAHGSKHSILRNDPHEMFL